MYNVYNVYIYKNNIHIYFIHVYINGEYIALSVTALQLLGLVFELAVSLRRHIYIYTSAISMS